MPQSESSLSNPTQDQDYAIHSKTKHRDLVSVARKIHETYERLARELKKARQENRNFITITYDYPGISYLIEDCKGYYALSIRYSKKCSVCYIFLEFKYKRFSNVYEAFSKTCSNFIKIFREILTVHYKIPAYLEYKHWSNPHGIRIAILGVSSDEIADPIHSMARALDATGVQCDIRIVDHQRGDV